ncbi:threonyl-tRNA synthetase [Grosmannia clavigera kw1407]|uniref:threonine--tRNA ligase n=1 Tax=Grosmannia clavigera (strain kw1407 / UAMH 11150) TaxID=655863 RepID=F0XGT8_GROCL|nr:threonyl-tRNA synthetase [Grosmannia clavigera kw1407]EFX03175.1 threonyl-tRNA synthetase [Grosmannia clavigera kw1407]
MAPPKAGKVVVPVADAGPPPNLDFLPHRIALYDRLKAEADAELASKPRVDITVTLPDGRTIPGTAWETRPYDIARGISKSLADRTVISRVDGDLWDLMRPLEADAQVSLLDFEDDEAKQVYWHSSAHILGEAAEKAFGCHLCFGPPTDEGFFYDFGMPAEDGQGRPNHHSTVTDDDHKRLSSLMDGIVRERQPFERLVMTKADLLEMFKFNKYKQVLINSKIPDGTSTTVYRCGPLIDLCRGPHVVDTSRIKAFAVLKHSASYFLGDAKNDSLQRVYGISFPDKKLLSDYMKFLEEAAKKDHRRIGQDQELFFFHKLSPGSPFFLPHGMRIFNALKEFILSEYHKRDYVEVMSPNMFNADLWRTSGHWEHYQEDMFTLEVEKQQWALKPMNCPGHCVIFGSRERSYRELPLRMAEFGILHRNEASGALSGLTRVRRFIQDDSHIFCEEDQIGSEIRDLFDFLRTVYGKLGMKFRLKLSTRPEKYLGNLETWDKAEATLQHALEEFTKESGAEWSLNPGDGAFYGPKIDIQIMDALRRWHQCATLQLDFQLPQQFNLSYMTAASSNSDGKAEAKTVETKPVEAETKDGKDDSKAVTASAAQTLAPGYSRPVMIHRAVLGSFERFIATLSEHFAGKWPFWLSPRQILLVPVMADAEDYVREVQKVLKARGFYVDSDLGANTMNKKIRNGQVLQYNFIFVLGSKEMQDRSVSIRVRDSKGDLTTLSLDVVVERLSRLRETKGLGLDLNDLEEVKA